MNTTTQTRTVDLSHPSEHQNRQSSRAALKALETIELRIRLFREDAGSSYCLMRAIEDLIREIENQVGHLKRLNSEGETNPAAGLPEKNGANAEDLVASVLRYPDAQLRRKLEAMQAALRGGLSQDRATSQIVSA